MSAGPSDTMPTASSSSAPENTASQQEQTVKSEIPNTSSDPPGEATRGDSNEPTHPKERKRRLDVDPSMILSEGRSKRRKTPSPGPETLDKQGENDPKDPVRAKMLGLQIYNMIMEKKDTDGESMSQPFVKLPNKRSFPDYYETIKHPMSLEIIHEKLEASSYETLREVCNDIGQMFTNAKRYNIKESILFQYAKKLHKMTRTFYTEMTSPPNQNDAESESEQEGEPTTTLQRATASQSADVEGYEEDAEGEDDMEVEDTGAGSSTNESSRKVSGHMRKRGSYMKDGPSVYKLIKPIVRGIKEAKSNDGRGRDIAAMFLELPDRKVLPDYYKSIKLPISLNEIEAKLIARTYQSPEQFYEDVELMCNNAMFYNEDASVVFNDAQQIKGLLEVYKLDVKDRLSRPQIPRSRLKASTITPLRIGATGPRATSSTPADPRPTPPIQTPQLQSSYPSQHSYGAQQPYPIPSTPSFTPQPPAIPAPPPSQSPIQSTSKPYLPALPQGVVTEEIVASLARYPLYEQQAWIQSLPPLAKQIYNQFQAANEVRKNRSAPGATPSSGSNQRQVLADLPSSGRPNGKSGIVDRQKPPLPLIKHMDFSFSTAQTSSPPLVLGLNQSTETKESGHRQVIRLFNMRGVVTHAVIIGSETSEIEITAFIADPPKSTSVTSETTLPVQGATETIAPPPSIDNVPEVSLRVNGNVGGLPRFIFDESGSGGMEKERERERERPKAMKWVVSLPVNRTDTKIEVVASKPGMEVETSTVFVNRQY